MLARSLSSRPVEPRKPCLQAVRLWLREPRLRVDGSLLLPIFGGQSLETLSSLRNAKTDTIYSIEMRTVAALPLVCRQSAKLYDRISRFTQLLSRCGERQRQIRIRRCGSQIGLQNADRISDQSRRVSLVELELERTDRPQRSGQVRGDGFRRFQSRLPIDLGRPDAPIVGIECTSSAASIDPDCGANCHDRTHGLNPGGPINALIHDADRYTHSGHAATAQVA